MILQLELPKGFTASGVNCGVRKYRPDLGLVVSDRDCVVAGVFTRNKLKAAPVQYAMKLLPADNIRALIVNSGQANVATGPEGVEDNLAMTRAVAEHIKIRPEQVLTGSTGVVGQRIAIDKVLSSVPDLVRWLSDNMRNFSLAIMTTDLVPKATRKEVQLSGGKVVIAGATKGSGMIHPNMGTMLGYILTDVVVEKDWLAKEIKLLTDDTFNMISVDGETSTNDTVLIMANGASGVKPKDATELKLLTDALREVMKDLAISIARDGEGASRLITVNVKNAPSLELGREIARMVTTSPLVKSAMYGEDPNWGRIMVRVGMTDVDPSIFQTSTLAIQGIAVYAAGKPLGFDRAQAAAALKSDSIVVDLDLNAGRFNATAWGCDLTERYVEINAEYS